jgi:hypothetical protein
MARRFGGQTIFLNADRADQADENRIRNRDPSDPYDPLNPPDPRSKKAWRHGSSLILISHHSSPITHHSSLPKCITFVTPQKTLASKPLQD